MAAIQGMPFDHLVLVATVAFASVSHKTVTIGDSFCQLLPPKHYTDNRLKHTPIITGKEAYFLVLELWPEGQASGLAYT